MTSTMPPHAPTAAPVVKAEAQRRARLTSMKRRATALLAAVTAVFVGVTAFGGDSTAAGYVQAMAEAAMVGGLADWFAVVALFRHPLGIPIPHTAIVVERKDQFAETLGEFIQDAFLTPDAVVERVRAAGIAERVGAWLVVPANAERVATEVLQGAVRVADVVRDEDVHRTIEEVVRERVDAVAVAPLAGRTLEFLIRDGRHQEVLDVGLRELDRYLTDHQGDLRDRLAVRSPWWLPGAAEDRIFERLVDAAHTLIDEMLRDGDHHLRRQLEWRLHQLAADLQTSESMLARGEALKAELLGQPAVRRWVATLWEDAKAQLRSQASDPASALHQRLQAAVVTTGERLAEDPALRSKLDEVVERAVAAGVDRFQGEIVELVRGTIARWDAEETADRLELLLGPDLQFIRINGTVVGALAGLVLHALAQVLGG